MKKIVVFSVLMFLQTTAALAQLLTGYVLLNGEQIPAQYTKLTNNTVALGNGHNACISQYSEGRVCVPGKVTISGQEYTVKEIMGLAFRLCNKLTFVDVQDNVERIGDFAFIGCSNLHEVELPATLASIGSGAFIDLPLYSVRCEAVTPPVWEYNDVFIFHEGGISDPNAYYYGSSVVLNVPEEAEGNYEEACYSDASLGWTTPDGWGKCFTTLGESFYEAYRIYSPRDLDMLRQYCNGDASYKGSSIRHVYLEADIDMSGYEWPCGIGVSSHEFRGSFDGKGHTISNLTVTDEFQSGSGAGLFGLVCDPYYDDVELRFTNLRLKDCYFSANNNGGGLVGCKLGMGDWAIDSLYIDGMNVESDNYAGGLVGRSQGTLSVRDCAVFGGIGRKNKDGSTVPKVGSVVGQGTYVDVNHCAFGVAFSAASDINPFVGVCAGSSNSQVYVTVDSCYTTFESRKEVTGKYAYGDHIVYRGDTYQYHTAVGDVIEHTFDADNMTGFYLVPNLGFDNWVYKRNEYPLPDCFYGLWPVVVNELTIGPDKESCRQVNRITPVEVLPAEAWRTNDPEKSFYYKQFTAYRLWIDETIAPDHFDRPHILPIGCADITASDGVRYDRTLKAINTLERETEEQPIYELDDDGNLLLDGNGQPTIVGYQDFDCGWIYNPVGYSIYLPYNMQLSSYCKLYQPRKVEIEDGVTTVTFTQVEGNLVEAFKPYYVVVEEDTVQLTTYTEAICPPMTVSPINLGSYEFKGTNHYMSWYEAGPTREGAYILQSDGKWHRVGDNPNAYIPAFRSYFRPKSSDSANELGMAFEAGTDGVVEIKTTDADGTERYYDLSGRLLPGKPTKGAYIVNGKKKVGL